MSGPLQATRTSAVHSWFSEKMKRKFSDTPNIIAVLVVLYIQSTYVNNIVTIHAIQNEMFVPIELPISNLLI